MNGIINIKATAAMLSHSRYSHAHAPYGRRRVSTVGCIISRRVGLPSKPRLSPACKRCRLPGAGRAGEAVLRPISTGKDSMEYIISFLIQQLCWHAVLLQFQTTYASISIVNLRILRNNFVV